MSAMDPRIARTRQALRDALFELAGERPIDEISISELTDRAGTNRSTFYQHYADKGELLADVIDAIAGDLLQSMPPELEPDGQRAVLGGFMQHVVDNMAFYRRVFDNAGSVRVQHRVRERLADLLEQVGDRDALIAAGVPVHIAAASIAGSALAILEAWVNEPVPADASTAADWVWLTAHGGDATRACR